MAVNEKVGVGVAAPNMDVRAAMEEVSWSARVAAPIDMDVGAAMEEVSWSAPTNMDVMENMEKKSFMAMSTTRKH